MNERIVLYCIVLYCSLVCVLVDIGFAAAIQISHLATVIMRALSLSLSLTHSRVELQEDFQCDCRASHGMDDGTRVPERPPPSLQPSTHLVCRSHQLVRDS